VLTATAGVGYHYSAMVRSAASTGSARIRIIEYLAGVKVGQLDSPAVTLSTNWQKVEVDYTPVQTGSEIYFTVKDSPVAISETFDVDEATICPLGGTPNQAPNGVIATPASQRHDRRRPDRRLHRQRLGPGQQPAAHLRLELRRRGVQAPRCRIRAWSPSPPPAPTP
jgi:hypothetical protein